MEAVLMKSASCGFGMDVQEDMTVGAFYGSETGPGPAQLAGVELGSTIAAVNGRPVRSRDDVRAALANQSGAKFSFAPPQYVQPNQQQQQLKGSGPPSPPADVAPPEPYTNAPPQNSLISADFASRMARQGELNRQRAAEQQQQTQGGGRGAAARTRLSSAPAAEQPKSAAFAAGLSRGLSGTAPGDSPAESMQGSFGATNSALDSLRAEASRMRAESQRDAQSPGRGGAGAFGGTAAALIGNSRSVRFDSSSQNTFSSNSSSGAAQAQQLPGSNYGGTPTASDAGGGGRDRQSTTAVRTGFLEQRAHKWAADYDPLKALSRESPAAQLTTPSPMVQRSALDELERVRTDRNRMDFDPVSKRQSQREREAEIDHNGNRFELPERLSSTSATSDFLSEARQSEPSASSAAGARWQLAGSSGGGGGGGGFASLASTVTTHSRARDLLKRLNPERHDEDRSDTDSSPANSPERALDPPDPGVDANRERSVTEWRAEAGLGERTSASAAAAAAAAAADAVSDDGVVEQEQEQEQEQEDHDIEIADDSKEQVSIEALRRGRTDSIDDVGVGVGLGAAGGAAAGAAAFLSASSTEEDGRSSGGSSPRDESRHPAAAAKLGVAVDVASSLIRNGASAKKSRRRRTSLQEIMAGTARPEGATGDGGLSGDELERRAAEREQQFAQTAPAGEAGSGRRGREQSPPLGEGEAPLRPREASRSRKDSKELSATEAATEVLSVMSKEMQGVEAKLRQAEAASSNYEAQRDTSESRRSELLQENSRLSNEAQLMAAQLTALKGQLPTDSAEYVALQDDMDGVAEMVDELQSQIIARDEKNLELERQQESRVQTLELAMAQQLEEHSAALGQREITHAVALDSHHEKHTDVLGELNRAKDGMFTNDELLQELRASNDSQKELIDTYDEECTRLAEELETAETERDRLLIAEESLEGKTAVDSAELETLRSSEAELKEMLDEAHDQLIEMQEELDMAEIHEAETQLELDELMEETGGLIVDHKDVEQTLTVTEHIKETLEIQMDEAERAKMQKVVHRMIMTRVGFAFHTWRDEVQLEIKLRAIGNKVVRHLMLHKCGWAFSAWVEWVHAQKELHMTSALADQEAIFDAELLQVQAKASEELASIKQSLQLFEKTRSDVNRRLHREKSNRLEAEVTLLEQFTQYNSDLAVWNNEIAGLKAKICLHEIANDGILLQHNFHRWQVYTNFEKRFRLQMLAYVNRMRHRALSEYYSRWFDFVAVNRKMHIAQMRCMQRLCNRYLHGAFSSWCEFALSKQKAAEQTHHIMFLLGKHKEKFAIDRWKAFLAEAKEERKQHAWNQREADWQSEKGLMLQQEEEMRQKTAMQVVRKIMMREAAMVFHRWAEFVHEIVRMKQLVQKVKNRLTNMELHVVFNHWVEYTEAAIHEGALMFKMAARMMNIELHGAFNHWAETVAERKHNRLVISRVAARMLKGLLHRSWGRWAEYTAGQRREGDIMWKIGMRMRNLQLHLAFNTWAERVAEDVAMRNIVARLQSHMMQHLMSYVFVTWHGYAGQEKHNRYVVAKIVKRIMNGLLAAAFTSWHEHICFAIRSREIVTNGVKKFLAKGVRGCFGWWKEYAKTKVVNKIKLTKMISRLQHLSMRKVFSSWMRFTSSETNQRNKDELQELKRALASKADAERELAEKLELEKEEVTHRLAQIAKLRKSQEEQASEWETQQEEQRQANMSLEEKVSEEKRRRETLQQQSEQRMSEIEKLHSLEQSSMVQAKKDELERMEAELAEREEVQRQRLLALVVQRFKNRDMSVTFHMWLEFVQWRKRSMALINKVALRMQNGSLMRSFEHWRKQTQDSLRSARIVLKVGKRLARAKVASAFDAWVSWIDEVAHNRNIMTKIVKRISMMQLLSVFNSWADWAAEAKRTDAIMKKIVTRMLSAKLSGAFDAWVEWLDWELRCRRLSSIAATKLSTRIKRSTLSAWHKEVSEARRNTMVLMKIVNRMRSMKLAGAFTAWVDWTKNALHNKQLLLKISMKMTGRSLRGCFMSWCEQARSQRKLAVGFKRATAKFNLLKMQRAFKTWFQQATEARLTSQSDLLAELQARLAAQEQQSKRFQEDLEFEQASASQRLKQKQEAEGKLQSERDEWLSGRRELENEVEEERRSRMLAVSGADDQVSAMKHELKLAEREAKKQRITTILLRMQHRSSAAAFAAWKDFVVWRREGLITIRRIAIRMGNRTADVCFQEWKEGFRERKKNRALMQRIGAKLIRLKLSSAWNTWVEQTGRNSLRSKMLAQQASSLAMRRMVSLQRKAMMAWLRYVSSQHREVGGLEAMERSEESIKELEDKVMALIEEKEQAAGQERAHSRALKEMQATLKELPDPSAAESFHESLASFAEKLEAERAQLRAEKKKHDFMVARSSVPHEQKRTKEFKAELQAARKNQHAMISEYKELLSSAQRKLGTATQRLEDAQRELHELDGQSVREAQALRHMVAKQKEDKHEHKHYVVLNKEQQQTLKGRSLDLMRKSKIWKVFRSWRTYTMQRSAYHSMKAILAAAENAEKMNSESGTRKLVFVQKRLMAKQELLLLEVAFCRWARGFRVVDNGNARPSSPPMHGLRMAEDEVEAHAMQTDAEWRSLNERVRHAEEQVLRASMSLVEAAEQTEEAPPQWNSSPKLDVTTSNEIKAMRATRKRGDAKLRTLETSLGGGHSASVQALRSELGTRAAHEDKLVKDIQSKNERILALEREVTLTKTSSVPNGKGPAIKHTKKSAAALKLKMRAHEAEVQAAVAHAELLTRQLETKEQQLAAREGMMSRREALAVRNRHARSGSTAVPQGTPRKGGPNILSGDVVVAKITFDDGEKGHLQLAAGDLITVVEAKVDESGYWALGELEDGARGMFLRVHTRAQSDEEAVRFRFKGLDDELSMLDAVPSPRAMSAHPLDIVDGAAFARAPQPHAKAAPQFDKHGAMIVSSGGGGKKAKRKPSKALQRRVAAKQAEVPAASQPKLRLDLEQEPQPQQQQRGSGMKKGPSSVRRTYWGTYTPGQKQPDQVTTPSDAAGSDFLEHGGGGSRQYEANTPVQDSPGGTASRLPIARRSALPALDESSMSESEPTQIKVNAAAAAASPPFTRDDRLTARGGGSEPKDRRGHASWGGASAKKRAGAGAGAGTGAPPPGSAPPKMSNGAMPELDASASASEAEGQPQRPPRSMSASGGGNGSGSGSGPHSKRVLWNEREEPPAWARDGSGNCNSGDDGSDSEVTAGMFVPLGHGLAGYEEESSDEELPWESPEKAAAEQAPLIKETATE